MERPHPHAGLLLFLAFALLFACSTREARASKLIVPDDEASPAEALATGATMDIDTVLVRSGTYTTTVLSDLPAGNVLAGAVLYQDVSLLSHPDNLDPPVIDVGEPGPGETRVSVAIAGDTGALIDGFVLAPGPTRSLDAFASGFTMGGCTLAEGLRIVNCTDILLANNTITSSGDAIVAQESDLTLTGNLVSGAAGDGVTWVSSTGSLVVQDNTITGSGGFGLILSGTGVTPLVAGNVLSANMESGIFITLTGGMATIEGNTIWENGDIGVWVTVGTTATLTRNIVGLNQFGISCESPTSFDCNDFWMNTVADYDGAECGAHLTDFSLDPQFCCTDGSCFTLQLDSPCAPDNSGGCGLVGARPVSCGTASVEGTTWGQVKVRYRR
jgi:hypothetical protein